jgi:hypothetical protein
LCPEDDRSGSRDFADVETQQSAQPTAGAGERGKSGGVRVVYYFHSDVIPIFLLTPFAKNEKDNLSKSDRNSLAALVGELARHFKR